MNRQEAINIVKKNWPDSSFTLLKEALEFLIPELMNTDDEKIKKAIIKGITHAAEEGCFCADNYSVKECVAWLEKQGEQKPNFCHHEVDLSECSEEYRKAYYDGWNNCNQQHAQLEAEKKPTEWSEEDERTYKSVLYAFEHNYPLNSEQQKFVKSLKNKYT